MLFFFLIINLGITHIINAAASDVNLLTKERPDLFCYLHLRLSDSKTQILSKAIKESNSFIKRAYKEEKGKILIHCHQGVSRSVSLVIAYLIAEEHLSYEEALSKVKEQRSIAAPNANFERQLREYKSKRECNIL